MAVNVTTQSFLFATPDQNGKAPKCRFQTAWDVYFMANQLRSNDWQRDQRRAAVYNCFRGFPPTEYSNLVAKEMQNTSNVNWRMMHYRVTNQKSGYIDAVTDRHVAVDIRTRFGNAKERIEWSDDISQAYNRALWKWPAYFTNTEITLEEMLLNGKGLEIRDEKATWHTRAYHNYQILFPDHIRTDLSNLEEWAIRDTYKPVEFWNKFKDAKDNKNSKWNFWACLDVLRWVTGYTDWKTLSNDQYLRRIAEGNINLNRYYFKEIDVYIVFVKEYDNSITKTVVLRQYGAITEGRKMASEEDYLSKAGFLYCEPGYEKDGWGNIIYPFYGSSGSGKWHDTMGYGTEIYPQCREYDVLTNSACDAVRWRNMVFLKGQDAEQTNLLRQTEMGNGLMVLPTGVDFAQRAILTDIRQSEEVKQSIMGDMDRGTGNYGQVQRRTEQTARESELNFAQENKLDGTDLRRYNISQTHWHWGLYRFLTKCKAGWKGYEQFEVFKQYLEDAKVPEEAWQPENIDYFDSNFVAATGAAKVAALNQVVGLASGTSASPGEQTAKRMLASALIGRQNVDAILPVSNQEVPDEQRIISFENATLSNPNANPENAQVLPTDNHVEHLRGHISDAMFTADQCLQGIQAGAVDAQYATNCSKELVNKGAHATAHLGFLERDPSKKALVQQFGQAMQELKGKADQVAQNAQEMSQSEQESQGQAQSPEQLKLQYEAAMAAMKLDYQKQSDNMRLATKAITHEQKQAQAKDKAATSIAIERAKAESAAQIERTKRPKPESSGKVPNG